MTWPQIIANVTEYGDDFPGWRIQAIAIAGSVFLLYLIFDLVRRRRLQEKYALLWLATGIVMLVLSAWRDSLDILARTVGIEYAPSALFLIAVLFLALILLHFTLIVSKLTDRHRELVQKFALIERRCRELERRDAEE